MQVPKPSDETKERFRAIIPDAPGVEVKAMFGNLGAFVNGNMSAGSIKLQRTIRDQRHRSFRPH